MTVATDLIDLSYRNLRIECHSYFMNSTEAKVSPWNFRLCRFVDKKKDATGFIFIWHRDHHDPDVRDAKKLIRLIRNEISVVKRNDIYISIVTCIDWIFYGTFGILRDRDRVNKNNCDIINCQIIYADLVLCCSCRLLGDTLFAW